MTPPPEPRLPGEAPKVDRCVCSGRTFAEIKRVRDEGGLDFDALRRATGCCEGCALCEPYIRAMLSTGRTRFTLHETAPRPPER